jgi:hypothetical protein
MPTPKISSDIGIDAAFVGIEIRIDLHGRDERPIRVKSVLQRIEGFRYAPPVNDFIGRGLPI